MNSHFMSNSELKTNRLQQHKIGLERRDDPKNRSRARDILSKADRSILLELFATMAWKS